MGIFTFKRSLSEGIATFPLLPNKSLLIDEVDARLPDVDKFLPNCVTPKRVPKSLLNSSDAITIRDSTDTCLTDTSKVLTNERISLTRSAVSCTNNVLVRLSRETLPRLDKREPSSLPVDDLIKPAKSSALA